MGPGFRYHVATIVAVFMALGIGMVIGSSYLQEALVERLRTQLTQLNERFSNDIQPLREENEARSRALAALSSIVTRNALDKSRIAVVVTGDYADAVPQAADAIKAAGGTVASVTRMSPTTATRLETRLTEILADLHRWRPTIPDGREGVFGMLASVVVRGSSQTDIRAVAGTGIVETQGDYRNAVSAVVLIGGGRDEGDRRWLSVDYPLLDAMSEYGVSIVGAEPKDTVQSYIPAYQARNLSTVDNVDTDMGRTALVLLLAGERGSYGVKDTARDGILPLGASRP